MKFFSQTLILCAFFAGPSLAQPINILEREAAQAATQDTLRIFYEHNTCGLNYTHTYAVLGKKMEFYGLPYPGADQPADLLINDLPATAIVEKAFLWWDETGPDTATAVLFQNPDNDTSTIKGTVIGYGPSKCWGIGASAYRAEVTSLITGNGTYQVSGLPTDTTFLQNDVNGISLFIIYSDPTADYVGNLRMDDGFMMAKFETFTHTMEDVLIDTTGYDIKAFALFSDLQDENGTGIKLNHGNYATISEDYWDFEQKSSFFLPGQNTVDFGLNVPSDCGNLLFTGLYFKTATNSLTPTVQWAADTLSTQAASGYQWYLDGSILNGKIKQAYISSQSGSYHVVCTNEDACEYSSDTVAMVICQEKIKPNLERVQDSLWTDSIHYTIVWFKNGKDLEIDSVNYYIIPDTTASFWLMASDSFGCVSYSDTLNVSFVGIEEVEGNPQLIIFPNPVKDLLTIQSTVDPASMITIYNMKGQEVLREQAVANTIYIGELKKGTYLLRLQTAEGKIIQGKFIRE